jgi:F-type H+-transporting ATPase subunit gamma
MDVERTQARLVNAQTIEPMLGALRTISLGTWQSAASRLEGLKEISNEYNLMLGSLVPVFSTKRGTKAAPFEEKSECTRQLVVLAGTERGLCGRLDQDLIEFVKKSSHVALSPEKTELVVIGGRLNRSVGRQLFKPDKTISASSTALPAFSEVFELTKEWIRRIGQNDLSRVMVFFTTFQGATKRVPSSMQLLPFELGFESSELTENWPPPIIETDPAQLIVRVYEQLAAVRLYEALLQTKASIHSARFQMMEDSTKNAERLIEDLTVILQTERRQSITREMQELAVGAGLLQE